MRFSWIFMGLVCMIIVVTTVRGAPISNRDNLNIVARGETPQDTAKEIRIQSEGIREWALVLFDQAKENKQDLWPVLDLVKSQEWDFQRWKKNGIKTSKGNDHYQESLVEKYKVFLKTLLGMYNSKIWWKSPESYVDEEMQSLQSKSRPTEYYITLAGSDTNKQAEIEEISEKIDAQFNEWKKLAGTLQQLHDEADGIIKKPVLPSEKETEKLLEGYQELESKYLKEKLAIKSVSERLYDQRLALVKPT